MDLLEEEKPKYNNDDIIVLFTKSEYDYIKKLLIENYKLMCHFPKSKRTPNFYLFENIIKNKFDFLEGS